MREAEITERENAMTRTTATPIRRPRTARLVALAAAATAVATMLTGCISITVAPKESAVDVEHDVSRDIHAVRLSAPGDLTVQLGTEPGLTVRAPESVQSALEISEVDGTLVIDTRRPMVWFGEVDFVLTVIELDDVDLEGSGEVTVDFARASDVRITVEGSGSVSGTRIDAASVEASVTGSGSVRLDGTADRVTLSVEGSGGIRARTLIAQSADAAVEGSGAVEVHASADILARIEGSGDIEVSGGARITRDIEGSGDVIEVG